METFTILNCGTNFDRSKKGEIIADFGADMKGVEHNDFLINEGPGGLAKGHLMPGTFDPFTLDRTAKGKSPKWSQTPWETLLDVAEGEEAYNPGGHGFLTKIVKRKTKGAITGHGWDDNIRHAIATLAGRFPNLTARVNMIGWSRGAVTCLRIANWMKEFLGSAWEVNIFAIDPVPGIDAGEKLRDTIEVPDIVKDYVGILAMDEARGDFRPQDLSRLKVLDKTKSSVAFLPFPGVHCTPVKTTIDLTEVASVVRSLAYKFLKKRGTEFKQPEIEYSPADMCRLYARMRSKRKDYSQLMKKSFMAKQSGGIVPRNTTGASISPFFVNEHHRLVFKAAYPDIYTYFFTTQIPNPFGKVTTSYKAGDPWGQKFQQFYQSDQASFDELSGVFVLERHWKIGMPAFWTASAPGSGAGQLSAEAAAGELLVSSLVY